ncbi:MAG TPA: hypothetical protein VG722_08295 [Tepidisphaeraceae bacterium]|nr:hypothetical protein [Tepidisphaeraceae bacterium]
MLTKPQSASGPKDVRARINDLLARVTAKDRVYIERHLAACDSSPDTARGEIWRRMAGLLSHLVSLPPRSAGPQALTFFIPDGKYRQQVFVLEDKGDGVVLVYLPNISARAVDAKFLSPAGDDFKLPGSNDVFGQIVDGTMQDLPSYIKPMLGWNRKALRLTIGTADTDRGQLEAAETLCTLAAQDWQTSST